MTRVSRVGVSLAAWLFASISCSLHTSESGRSFSHVVAFRRADALVALPGNYVSVMDTAVLSVTSKDGVTQNFRARIGQRDSVMRFTVTVDAGASTFSAVVLSNNGTRLYSGQQTASLNSATDSVVIPLVAVAPVLVLSLEFTTQDVGNQRTFRTRVHNRGRDALAWNVETPSTCGCGFSPATGNVTAGESMVFSLTTPLTSGVPPGITLTSAGGRVTLPSASVITPSIDVTTGSGALTIEAGTTGSMPVSLTRFGGFTGDVALAIGGLPLGVTATAAPALLTASATSSTITVAANATASASTGTVTITASGTGVASQTATFALAITPTPAITLQAAQTLSVRAGTSVSTPITISRIGNFAGDIALALENAPAGVSGVFTPAVISGTGTTSSLTLAASATAVPGNSTITVRATGSRIATQTAPIALTVLPAPGYTLAASSVSAIPGTNATSTISLTRQGGFDGAVTLAVTGLPAGVSGSFAPLTVTGTTASLALRIASTVAPGVYRDIAVVGSATALRDVTTPLTLTINPRPTLTVTGGGVGTGSGRITSSPTGVDCSITNGMASGACAVAFDATTTVQLQVAAGVLTAWGGDCTGVGACSVVMTQSRSVSATLSAPVIVVSSTKPVVVMNRFEQVVRVDYPITNGGSGTLLPTVTRDPDATWLTDLFVVPNGTSHNLRLSINTTGLRSTSEANSPYTTSATISSQGAAPVRVAITFVKSFEPATAMSTTAIRLHGTTARPMGSNPSTTLVPRVDTIDLLDGRTGAKIAAERVAIQPATRNWLSDTINARGQLVVRYRDPDAPRAPTGALPSSTNPNGAPIRISLSRVNAVPNCQDLTPRPAPDPRCQLFVYYTTDASPRMALRPWGVQLTAGRLTDIARVEIQQGTNSELSLGAVTYLSDDCGDKLARRPIVTDTSVTVAGSLAALPEDSLFRCTVKIRAPYGTGLSSGVDTAQLTVTLAKPSDDAITPSHRDLNVVTSSGTATFIEMITLYNLGTRTITLGAPQLVNNACGSVLGTPTLSGSDGVIGLGMQKTLQLSVSGLGPIPSGVCTATLRLTSATPGVAVTDIPVTVRRN